MPILQFTALCVFYLGLLLGLRFALPEILDVGTPEAVTAAQGNAAMAVPPKPEGLEGAKGPATGAGAGGKSEYTLEACQAMATELYRTMCFQVLARKSAERDPLGALETCKRIVDMAGRDECESDVAESIAPRDRVVAERICDAIESTKWRGQCHFGIGLATAEIDPVYAMDRCNHAEVFLRFCRHDVVGEVALVDVDAAVAACAKGEGDDLTRDTCWHGIGKYLARRDLGEAVAACERVPEDSRSQCYHGLGWGGSERDPDDTLGRCAGLGEHADSCRAGVAYQHKRNDPTRAVALCEAIATESIRERCMAFVTR